MIADEPIPQLGVVNIFGALEVSKYLHKFYGYKFKSKCNKTLKEYNFLKKMAGLFSFLNESINKEKSSLESHLSSKRLAISVN